uniref:REF/SRPP-like protein At1g67360 n=1 Tax=Caenorhabditis tropicalis TaxID=1561998 RepID=A0A1I7TN92_9PELO
MAKRCVHSKLEELQSDISEMAKKAFSNHYSFLLSNVTDEEKTDGYKQYALTKSMETGLTMAHTHIEEVISELATPNTPPSLVKSVKEYLESNVLRKLESYKQLFPLKEAKEVKPVEKKETKECCSTRKEDEKPAISKENVKEAILSMNRIAKQHVDVFPPPIRPGAVVIPTGRLVKCQCKPDCPVDLPEPEYRVIQEPELRNRWAIEPKTGNSGKKNKKSRGKR